MGNIYRNLRKTAKELCAGAAGALGELQEVQAFELSAKSQIRLTIGATIVKFYEDIGRPLDPENMKWTVLKRFNEQHKASLARKTGDSTYVPPKLTKTFSTYKWLESFVLCLCQKVGVRNCPLEYVVCKIGLVAAACCPLKPNEPHLLVHGGSIEGNMIVRMSHTHPLFKVDNGAVFELIENSVCGTAIAASIAPFQKDCNGLGAFMAIQAQHAGKDVWDKLHKEAESTLQTYKWLGTANVTLAQHMGKHRQAFITLTECAEHIPVDVPNKQARVTYLMESINSVDPTVLAALVAVCQDETGKRVNFKDTFAYLVVICPVEAKLAKKRKVTFQAGISGAEGSPAVGLGGNAKKPGFGTTDVALRYQKHKDFMKLPKNQKDELTTWQKANVAKNGPGKRTGQHGETPRPPRNTKVWCLPWRPNRTRYLQRWLKLSRLALLP
jgi:hypothetical protein